MAGFDVKAENYDQEFSHSLVGSTQRNIVHQCLHKILEGKKGLNILELNCGTGEDIPFLKKFGKVMASDVSSSMLEMARKKNPDVDFTVLDLNKTLPDNEKYDIIFSNFGGFNCISKHRLQELSAELNKILNPGGSLIIVFISKWSLIEFIYFFLRLNFNKALRRVKGKAMFNELPIYYYSIHETREIFKSFNLTSIAGIGRYYTGEYMNKWAPRLGINEPLDNSISLLYGADHILFNFVKENDPGIS